MTEHVSVALRRGLRKATRRLAPLEPDAFLRWAWLQGDRAKGTLPLTVEDLYFELGRVDPALTIEQVRKNYVHLAARVRRNQRLGLEPFEGIC